MILGFANQMRAFNIGSFGMAAISTLGIHCEIINMQPNVAVTISLDIVVADLFPPAHSLAVVLFLNVGVCFRPFVT